MSTTVDAPTVFSFPSFDHSVGDPVEADIHLHHGTKVVLVEGNYLLLTAEPAWARVRSLFDMACFISYSGDSIGENAVVERLVARHMHSWNISAEEAMTRILNNDILNARLIEQPGNGSQIADLVINTVTGEVNALKCTL